MPSICRLLFALCVANILIAPLSAAETAELSTPVVSSTPDAVKEPSAEATETASATAEAPTTETQASTSEAAEKEVSLFSAEDGWLDLSEFIDQAYGFIPLVIPITEPAVGYGATVGMVFVDREVENAEAGFVRPNPTFIGGLQTENETKGAFAADSRYWFDDQMQSLIAGFDMSVNLDYYGTGQDPMLENDPQRYNVSATGAVALGRFRLGDSRSWLGLGYLRADTELQFKRRPDQPELEGIDVQNKLAGLLPEYTYDSRDSVFIPGSGFYFSSSMALFSPELGGEEEFQRLSLFTMGFWPVTDTVTIGAAAGSIFSAGDTPIYLRPYIQLRGAPAVRYQGEYSGQIEAEVRWQFWRRFSVVAFAGAGTA